ncbi:MAG: hypothetical protein N3B12_08950, partial [Armatimonadetes bacterium]|nr:hypothetical protein [Armatimonadota bacterium]
MHRKLLMIGLAAIAALAGCGGGGKTNTPVAPSGSGTVSQMITASTGGIVSAPYGTGKEIKVSIPAGALASNTTIQITTHTVSTLPTPLGGGNVLLAAATFGPAGTNFSSPATITFPLPKAKPVGAQLVVLILNSGGTGWNNFGLATVNTSGTTASIQVNHFSTYALVGSSQISGTASNGPGMGFIFANGVMFDGAPVDFAFIVSPPSIQPNHSPAMVSTNDYAAITQAPDDGYSLSNDIPIQAGTVILFKGQMPGDTNYYKMKVLDIQGNVLTFVYETILPPITGQWNLGTGNTMSIMKAVGAPGYVIDIHDAQHTLLITAQGLSLIHIS